MTSTACLGSCLGKNRPADPKPSWLLTRCGKRPMTSVDGNRHDCLIAQASFQADHCPLRRCFPGQSTSGCTTRMCRVSASLREKVFSSVHK